MAVFLDAERSLSIPLACILVAAHVLASRIKFEVGAGFTVPTQLVFVPMLFLLPTPLVPLLVAFGEPAGRPARLPARQAPPTARDHRVRGLVVFARPGARARRVRRPDAAIEDWPIYVAALVAQSGSDFVVTSSREWFELGRKPLRRAARLGLDQRRRRAARADRAARDVHLAGRRVRASARATGHRSAVRVRPRAPARPRQRPAAAQRLSRDDDPARRPDRGRRRVHRPPQQDRRVAVAPGRGRDGSRPHPSAGAPSLRRCSTTSARSRCPRRSSTSPAR